MSTPIASLDALVLRALRASSQTRMAVAACAEEFVMQACVQAHEMGLIEPVFVGHRTKAESVAERIGIRLADFEFHEADEPEYAVQKSLELFHSGSITALMKGRVNTDVLLRGVLNRETGVPPQGVLSHLGLCNAPQKDRLLMITDAGINIAPNLQRKIDIVKNALSVARALGIATPKVAMLAATEKVLYPGMPATLDAQMVSQMAEQGEFGDALVAGPLSLDLAVSARAVDCKGMTHPVCGNADILVAPDINSGNILYKALSALMDTDMAGIVAGSRIPIVLASRGDTDRTKFCSIALATLAATFEKDVGGGHHPVDDH